MRQPLIIEARERFINDVLRKATPAQMETGVNWYPIAHDFALEIAGGDLEKGAGVIAAFSPQNGWEDNMIIARRAFDTGIVSGHTPANNAKVARILNGEAPLAVLGGNKVRSFYANIVNPADVVPVTIDRHAVGVGIGRVPTKADIAILGRKGAYEAFVKCYYASARRFGMIPSVLQATTWVTFREMKGLK
jgi:hypothetical protein